MKILQSLLISAATFILPVQGILIAVAAATFLEACTSYYKCKKLRQSSSVFRSAAAKAAIFEMIALFVYFMDHFLLSEFFRIWFSVDYVFTKFIAMALIFVEMFLIKENIEKAHEFSFFRMLKALMSTGKEIKKDINDLTL